LIGADALLFASDILVVKALESVGKRLVSADRSRYSQRREEGIPFHLAHTRWTAQPGVEKTLDGAWDSSRGVFLSHGVDEKTVDRLIPVLDAYTRELIRFRLPHETENLARRLGRDL